MGDDHHRLKHITESINYPLISRNAIALQAEHSWKKPNPLTPFPAREGGTRDSGSPLLRGEGLGERSSTTRNETYFLTQN